MFEFAISQHKKWQPTRRWIGSYVFSVFAHVAAVVILIENPHLLAPGKNFWLRLPVFIFHQPDPKEAPWRSVAVLGARGPMQLPSAETLRQYAYNWRQGEQGGGSPPVRIARETGGSQGTTRERVKPLTATLGKEEPKPQPDIPAAAPAQAGQTGATTGESRAGAPVEVGVGPAPDKRPTIYLPAPAAAPKRAETAESPKLVPPAEPPKPEPPKPAQTAQQRDQPKIFTDQQSAIRSQESGFFDTKGFPLGEYARIVLDKVKGNWLIPSNLRNSQGRSTIVFYIDKDGRVLDARIVASSGSNSLDLAALSSVLGSMPFPPLPRGFPGNHVGAKFVFAYNEHP